MSKTFKAAVAALAVMAIIIASATPPAAGALVSDDEALAKIAGELRQYLSSKEPVEVVILLREVPDDHLLAERHSGGREAVVESLKYWAMSTQESVARAVKSYGGEVLNRFWITNAIVARVPGEALLRVAANPLVRKVIPNYVIELNEPEDAEPAGDGRISSWGIDKIEAKKVWQMGYNGSGVRVAVLDTGVDISHEALKGKMLTLDPNSPYYPGGWMEFDTAGNPIPSVPHDTRGHGTHVSGTVLGGDGENIVIGVAPGAELMHGLVLPYGRGTFAQIIGGIEWAVDPYYIDINTGQRVYTHKPAHIISMSFGARNYFGDEFLEPIKHALMANVIPVAAAGNGGAGTIDNPGNIWGVFAIGATDEEDQPAYFSGGMVVNWPNPPADWPFNDTYPSTYIKPDFSAPGVHITSAVPGGGYESWSGTSMATPHVSGVIALILEATKWYESPPQDLPEMVYSILAKSSLDLGKPGQDTRYGWGRVNAYDAVLTALQYAKISGVSGFVTDTYSGEPVADANVSIYTMDGELVAAVLTNGSGYFKVGLDPGTYRVVVERFGYVQYETVVNVVILNGTLAGAVLDEESGEPIAGAVVEVLEAGVTATTDSRGGFSISLLPGRYHVRVSASGYYPVTEVVDVEENETTIADFRLYPSTTPVILRVIVRNELTGEPIAGANVSIPGAGVWNLTGSGGEAVLTGYPPGTYEVVVEAPGMVTREYQVMIGPGETVLKANTTWHVGILTYSTDDYGRDIKEALMYYGYPSYAIDLISPDQGIPSGLAVLVINYLGTDPGENAWAGLIDALTKNGTSLVLLDAWGDYYSFAGYLMSKYSTRITGMGYPAPKARVQDYVQGVAYKVLNADHPLFRGIDLGDDSTIPVASSPTDRADFAAYPAFDDPTGHLKVLARLVAGTTDYGASVAVWEGNGSKWVFLSAAGSYQWNMYMEKGADCQYSEGVRKLLFNSVIYAAGADPESVAAPSATSNEGKAAGFVTPEYYTELSIGLSRKPFGWVEGVIYAGDTGEAVEGARVYLEGEPVEAFTNASGFFRLWLPAGEYSLKAYAPGYFIKEFRVAVTAGSTAEVNITLSAAPRAAVMLDYGNQISGFLKSRGWYAEPFDDWGALLDAVVNRSFDVLILSGQYMGSYDYWPSEEEFGAVINATKEKGMGVVFLSNFFEYRYMRAFPYGINLLYFYEKDPRLVGADFDKGIVYYVVEKEHPILSGYSVGEKIPLIEGGDYDFSWFEDWGGEVIASIGAESAGVKGAGVGVKVTEAGTRWVLLAGLAPEQWTNMEDWSEDAKNILYNAVVWAAVKPLAVEASEEVVKVGDNITISVAGAKGVNVTVTLDNEVIYEGPLTGEGINITITVPHIPAGEHRIVAYSEGKYFGEVIITVVTDIKASVAAKAGARWVSIDVTGAPAAQALALTINDNYVTTILTNPDGDASANITVPDYIPGGVHELKLVTGEGQVLASATIELPESPTHSALATISGKADEALAAIQALNKNVTASIASATNTTIEALIAKVDQASSSIMKALSDLGTELGAVSQAINDVNEGVKANAGKLGNVEAGLSNVAADLEEVKNTLSGVREASESTASAIPAVYAAAALALLAFIASAASLVMLRKH